VSLALQPTAGFRRRRLKGEGRMVLTAEERQHLPGWLIQMIDQGDEAGLMNYCYLGSDRYLLSVANRELDAMKPAYISGRDPGDETKE
jgi:hypothetical protein